MSRRHFPWAGPPAVSVRPDPSPHGLRSVVPRWLLVAGWAGAFVLAGLSTGCTRFSQLKSEVRRLDADLYLRGVVAERDAAHGVVIVAIYQQPAPGQFNLFELALLGVGESSFAFSLPPGQNYVVAAFEDRNGNQLCDADEPAWVNGRPDPVTFDAQRRSPLLRAELRVGAVPTAVLAALKAARTDEGIAAALDTHYEVPVALGRLMDFGAPRFSKDAGQLGFWEPATFMNQYGLGVYFLEPYDPRKIPVLLVHGAGGTPGDWKTFAPQLDSNRFQVWFYAYPSGTRLAESAKALEKIVAFLQARYGFNRMDVVAHSMGGLVAREFILQAADLGHAGCLQNFITLSTPWTGHEAAALGVNYAPAAIPSWRDVETGSEFTRRLFARPLPATTTYHLGFTFHGTGSLVLPDSNDGVVSLASQLADKAQASAASVHGFDLKHDEILVSPEAVRWVESKLPAPPVAAGTAPASGG